MAHNAEPEAVDLLVEVEALGELEAHVDAKNYARTCVWRLCLPLLLAACASCCLGASLLPSSCARACAAPRSL